MDTEAVGDTMKTAQLGNDTEISIPKWKYQTRYKNPLPGYMENVFIEHGGFIEKRFDIHRGNLHRLVRTPGADWTVINLTEWLYKTC